MVMRWLLMPVILFGIACDPGPANTCWQRGCVEENGLATNALLFNGVWDNGVWDNGVWDNGFWNNGVWDNGVWDNGVWDNGVWDNGVWDNGLWESEAWKSNPAAADLLRPGSPTYNPNTGELLKYIYECAMPVDKTTTLDLGNGDKLELKGSIGLQPQWDTVGGTCDQSCQRWVSACVLARTNAFGVKVPISMRVADTAPDNIKRALALVAGEADTFPVREGTYYGNLFQRHGPLPGIDGSTVNSPTYYACAGRGSNIPDLTRRFTSSQGHNGPIEVHDTCDDECGSPASDEGAVAACPPRDPSEKPFEEVITVYVKDLIAVCGNAICENAEAEDASCPSDCHPNTWAKSFDGIIMEAKRNNPPTGPLAGPEWSRVVAVAPDDSIILGGVGALSATVWLGDEFGTLPGAHNQAYNVVAKYDRDGKFVWGRQLSTRPTQGNFKAMSAGSVAVDGAGNIVISAAGGPRGDSLIVGKLDSSGAAQWWLRTSASSGGRPPSKALAIDSRGNIIIGGSYRGAGGIVVERPGEPPTELYRSDGQGTVEFPADRGQNDAFLLKVSPDGTPQWLLRFGDEGNDDATDVTVDRNDNVIVTLVGDTSAIGLIKLSPQGQKMWSRKGDHWAVTTDASGDVYATGKLQLNAGGAGGASASASLQQLPSDHEFSLPSAVTGDYFLAKYTSDGTPVGAVSASRACEVLAGAPAAPDGCQGTFTGLDIGVVSEPNGGTESIVVAVRGGLTARPTDAIDFGAGLFHSFGTQDVYVASYSTDLAFRWAKHVPMILDGVNRGTSIDSRGHIVMGGAFAGSMVIDGRLLVSNVPEETEIGNMFLGSFAPPSLTDHQAPVVANVSPTITVEATGIEGATIWYPEPTATDHGNAGVSVACSPMPNTTLPVGQHIVSCRAHDPLGNTPASPTTFTIKVVDRVGPSFRNVPRRVFVEATGPSGATVTYVPPIAIDQVDGILPVTCTPPSGATYPLNTLTKPLEVECTALDSGNRAAKVGIPIVVRDTTKPVLSVPNHVNASSTTGVATWTATATDLVDPSPQVTCFPPSGSTFPVGTSAVLCTATDSLGNGAIAQFKVQRAP